MSRILRPLAAAAAALLLLAGCGGGSSDLDNELRLRYVQAAADAPQIEYRLDSAIQEVMQFPSMGRFLPLTPATYEVTLNAILANQQRDTLHQQGHVLAAGIDYTLISAGSLADASGPTIIEIRNPLVSVTAGFARIEVVHAAPGQPALDVWLTAPDTALSGATPLGGAVNYTETLDRQEIPAGAYRLRLTAAGSPEQLIFDSGSAVALPLASSRDFLFVVVPNTGPGPSPVQVHIGDVMGGLQTLADAATQAELRVVHLAPEVGPVRLVASPASGDPLVIDAVPYASATGFITRAPGTYSISATPADDLDDPLFAAASRGLVGGQRLTIFITGLSDPGIAPIFLPEDLRPIATAGRLFIYNASHAAGTVDAYLLPAGTALGEATNPRVLQIGGSPGRIDFPPGDYTLTMTAPGTKDVVASMAMPLPAGSVLSAILHDAPRVNPGDDGTPVALLLIDDLAMP